MKKILASFILPIAALAVVSCSDEVKREESPAFNEGAEQVFFYDTNPVSLEILPTDSEITLLVGRENWDYSSEVKLKLVDNTGAFTIPSTVAFEAGDSVAEVTIQINTNSLEFFKDINIEILIDDQNSVNPYLASANGVPSWNLSILVSDYALYANCVWQSEFFEEAWDQPLLYSAILDCYRLPDLYETGFNLDFAIEEDGTIVPQAPLKSGLYYVKVMSDLSGYGLVTWRLDGEALEYDKEANTIFFTGAMTVSAGSFGAANETLVIQEIVE